MEPTKTVKMKRAPKLGAEQRRTGYLFILPNCIIFVLFFIIPAVLGFYYSLTEYNGFGSPEFIGFENYAELFTDGSFYKILWHTFLYVILTVPTVFCGSTCHRHGFDARLDQGPRFHAHFGFLADHDLHGYRRFDLALDLW